MSACLVPDPPGPPRLRGLPTWASHPSFWTAPRNKSRGVENRSPAPVDSRSASWAFGRAFAPPAPLPAPPARNTAAAGRAAARAVVEPKPTNARHILGAFQFSVLVKTASEILPGDESNLATLQRVIATVPVENRWYPVLQRYISQLGARVVGLCGKPGGGPGHGHAPRPGEKRIGYEGKISGLRFDRFGDFEGFWLDTEDGKRTFRSREKEVEKLVSDAWARRIAVLVIVESEDRNEPQSIVLRPPADP